MPTAEDAKLILHLYEARREERMRQAREWFATHCHPRTMEEWQQLCPPGSSMNTYFRQVTSYWEMVASFVASGVLDAELFFQSGTELLFVWERIRDIVPSIRQFTRNPLAFRNLEAVAQRYIEYLNANGPGAYEAFSRRIRKE